jgi:hypothetical protein
LTGGETKQHKDARVEYKELWIEVLAKAKSEAGISDAEWPFCVRSMGRSAFYVYFRKVVEEHARETDRARHGDLVADRRGHNPLEEVVLPKLRALSCLQLDYAKIDAASVFEMELPDGQVILVPVSRWYWGMLYCPTLKAVVGFHVNLSKNPSSDDLIDILASNALGLNDAGLRVEIEEGGDDRILLNAFFPEFKGHGMSIIRLDNGWANMARHSIRSLIRVYGCAINLGKVKRWMDRKEIEREFGTITRRGPKKLSSTYGTDPTDSRRTNPNKEALEKYISLKDVMRILAKAVQKSNTMNKKGLFGTSPVDELGRLIKQKASGVFPMPLPKVGYPEWIRFTRCEPVVVRAGTAKSKRHPYVEKWGATYTCDKFCQDDSWIGRRIWVFLNGRNANQAYAVDGKTRAYIGELTVTGLYEDVPQSIVERRHTEAAIREGDYENVRVEVRERLAEAERTGQARRQSSKPKPRKKAGDKALEAARREQNALNPAAQANTQAEPVTKQPDEIPVQVGASARTLRLVSNGQAKATPKQSDSQPKPKKPNKFGLSR